MSKTPLFVPPPLENAPVAFPLWPLFPHVKGHAVFTEGLPKSFFTADMQTLSVAEARAIVLPNAFTGKEGESEYIKKYIDLGEKTGVPVFIFCTGDLTDRLTFDPRVYVFRQSVYRSTMQPQDIVIPTLVADSLQGEIRLRTKGDVPTVSFCGQGGYNTLQQRLKYHLKVWLWKLKAIANPMLRAKMVGVYWRKKMMQACSNTSLVKTLFIVRRSFSGAHRTIELDPVQARKEFVDSIVNSDFVLAPKGDGNYSNRFIEALSLGRIPVLLDTDTVLPLEETIDYAKVMVRVPMSRVQDTPNYIHAWYDKHTEEEWKLAQVAARELFVRALRLDAFFNYFFTEILPELPICPIKAK